MTWSSRCKADEILQMFGRAGRRGLDETGYVHHHGEWDSLAGCACGAAFARRTVDWSALLNLMAIAAHNEANPFCEAVRVQERLFTMKPISLGMEESIKHPNVPCNLHTDAERARHVRKRVREMLNSQRVNGRTTRNRWL